MLSNAENADRDRFMQEMEANRWDDHNTLWSDELDFCEMLGISMVYTRW